jgi:hypothetical protein
MRVAMLTAWLALISSPAIAAQPFVYLVTQPCAPGPACAPGVDVYNATTAGFVTRIPFPTGALLGNLAMSRDGRHVYVIEALSSGVSNLAVIDTAAQAVTSESFLFYTVPPYQSLLAAGNDPSQVLIVQTFLSAESIPIDTNLMVVNAATGAIVRTFVIPLLKDPSLGSFIEFPADFAASPTDNRAFLSTFAVPGSTERLLAIDTGSGATTVMASTMFVGASQLYMSPNGDRLFDATTTGHFIQNIVTAWDLSSDQVAYVSSVTNPSSGGGGGAESFRSGRAYLWNANQISDRDAIAGTASATFTMPGAVRSVAFAADDSRAWIESVNEPINNVLRVVDIASHVVVKTIPLLTSFSSNVVSTPPGARTCDYRMNTLQSSWSVNAGTATLSLTTSCPWVASSDSPWARIDKTSGTGDATITLTVDQNFTTTNRSGTITIGGQIVTVTQASFSATPPFGFVDTPADGTTGVSGSLNVSGWALDDVGVTRVRIYRDPVAGEAPGTSIYVGDGTFVDGARPDVQAMFASFPNASRAGWGLQVLTNMLPGGGNGAFRFIVYADDVDGHTTLLGARTVMCANGTSLLPFGTIDTPAQGQTVSGTIINFGWALAQPGQDVSADSSTITVLIDGVAVGHPGARSARGDITAAFPTFVTDHAVGGYVLDTTTLSNGVHTIAWIVTDSAGNTVGIGSRFFTVTN